MRERNRRDDELWEALYRFTDPPGWTTRNAQEYPKPYTCGMDFAYVDEWSSFTWEPKTDPVWLLPAEYQRFKAKDG